MPNKMQFIVQYTANITLLPQLSNTFYGLHHLMKYAQWSSYQSNHLIICGQPHLAPSTSSQVAGLVPKFRSISTMETSYEQEV